MALRATHEQQERADAAEDEFRALLEAAGCVVGRLGAPTATTDAPMLLGSAQPQRAPDFVVYDAGRLFFAEVKWRGSWWPSRKAGEDVQGIENDALWHYVTVATESKNDVLIFVKVGATGELFVTNAMTAAGAAFDGRYSADSRGGCCVPVRNVPRSAFRPAADFRKVLAPR